MPDGFNVTVQGLEEVQAKLRQFGEEGEKVVAVETYRLAEEIMTASKALVPVMDGVLRASGQVEPPTVSNETVRVRLGYSAPYALPVHENPRSGKTGGFSPSGKRYRNWARVGEWKFLERPFKLLAPQIVDRLYQGMFRLMARLSASGGLRGPTR